ncbi:MAG: hypothetical protein ACE5IF_01920 [Candidatus Bathyarchaeia archaeon]
MKRQNPSSYFQVEQANVSGSWEDVLKAIALIGFLVIAFVVVYKAVK